MKRRRIAQNVGPQDVLDSTGWEQETALIASRNYKAGAPAMSLPEWLGAAPEYDEDRIDEAIETDVIVCGAGISGVAAVRAACEEGADVVLFEKCSRPQARSGQFALVGGELYRRWGGDESRERRDEIVAHIMRDTDYRANQRRVRYWADNSGRDVDWYMAPCDLYICDRSFEKPPEGVRRYVVPVHHAGWMGRAGLEGADTEEPALFGKVTPYDHAKEMFPSYPFTADFRPGHQYLLNRSLEVAAETGRLRSYFDFPVKKLLREKGRVSGVIAESFDGRLVRAYARNGVVLATGGYSSNLDMLYYYCPWTRNCGTVYTGKDRAGKRPNTGDGHKMALWIGAAMDDFPHCPVCHPYSPLFGIGGFLQLNLNGERFMNEDLPGHLLFHQMLAQPGHYTWQFFDSTWKEQMQHFDSHYDILTYPEQVGENVFSAAEKAGRLYRADTLEELLRAIDEMPVEKALASIRRYNGLARERYDEDFGKRGDRMMPLERGPFYAYLMWPGEVLATASGLSSDENCQIFDGDGYPIPGLYAAGNLQGSCFSGSYPLTIPGVNHGFGLTFGRRAGINAARKFN